MRLFNKNKEEKVGKARKVLRLFNPFVGWDKILVKPATSQLKEVNQVLKDTTINLNPVGAYERAKAKSRNESFKEAYDRLNLTEEDLIRTYKFSVFMSRLGIALFVFCLALAFYFLFQGKVLNGLPMLSFCFVNLAIQHKYSFRAYQVSKRKLGNHDEFLKDYHNWVV